MTKSQKIAAIQRESTRLAAAWGLPKESFRILWDQSAPESIQPKSPKNKAAQYRWDAILKENTIFLNAHSLKIREVQSAICHEVAHLVYDNPSVRRGLDTLWGCLSKKQKEILKREINSTYPGNQKREELRVRALEVLMEDHRYQIDRHIPLPTPWDAPGPVTAGSQTVDKIVQAIHHLLLTIQTVWENTLTSIKDAIKPKPNLNIKAGEDFPDPPSEIITYILTEGIKRIQQVEKTRVDTPTLY
jgi:hypothetical protein